MTERFRVGLTRDLLAADGTAGLGDVGLGLLDGASGIAWEFLPERFGVLEAGHIQGYDAVAILGGRVPAASVDGADRLTILARYGVGYDTIDTDACTRNGIAVTIAPDGVRRPMATAILTLVLALSGRLLEQDRLVRAGGWTRKIEYMGTGLTGKTLGSIGLGNIGRELFVLAAPLQMRQIAHDPYAIPGAAPGVELVDLETLFRTADILVVTCALTPETHHLVNAGRIALMKSTAYLINTARGPVVDQVALTDALRERRIAGAGLDVFEREPIDPGDPLLELDNVIVTPHALGWTDEWIRRTGQSALGGILDVAAGREPPFVVNREVLLSPLFQEKLARRRR
jgi:phosphoglycerate dehydrogenase-like enzyme